MLYRRRELDLPHGTIETPVLFPVRNIGKRSSDNTPTYVGTIPEFSAAMINARSIRNRDPMWNRLTDNITLREEMDVPQNTIVFADSGGFDFSSEEVDTTPAETLETQRQLDADIFGTVDVPISRKTVTRKIRSESIEVFGMHSRRVTDMTATNCFWQVSTDTILKPYEIVFST